MDQKYGVARKGANGTREPFKAEKFRKNAPDSVYRTNAVAVARILNKRR
jgi:hypothetical protein